MQLWWRKGVHRGMYGNVRSSLYLIGFRVWLRACAFLWSCFLSGIWYIEGVKNYTGGGGGTCFFFFSLFFFVVVLVAGHRLQLGRGNLVYHEARKEGLFRLVQPFSAVIMAGCMLVVVYASSISHNKPNATPIHNPLYRV